MILGRPAPLLRYIGLAGFNRLGRQREADADHAILGDQLGQVFFAHALGAIGPLGEDQVALIGAAVDDLDLDRFVELGAELFQHTPGVDDHL